MNKLTTLRAHLLASPLKLEADKLITFADKGAVHSRPGENNDFEWRYTAHIIVTDFSQPAERFAFVLVQWINQHEKHRGEKAFGFDADLLDHDATDIAVTLQLTETVKVTEAPEGITLNHCDDPQLTETLLPAADWSLYINNELDPITQWVEGG
ncbi:MAG: phage tail protein [Candidatus Sedimenticola sp. (ex Thyasira tokunagai)]